MKKGMTFLSIMSLFIIFAFKPAINADDKIGGKNWEWNLAPFYLWAVSLDGNQTLGSNTGDIKVSFDQIFDNLDAAFIVNFQGIYRNQWGFIFDYNYLNVSDSATVPPGVKKSADAKLQLAELDGFHRWNFSDHALDLRFGLRGVSMDTDVQAGPFKANQKIEWLDPIIGGRWVWRLADRWKLSLAVDIGGAGIGSDLTWQAIGLIDWQPFKYVSFIGGYRALYFDYEKGNRGKRNYYNLDATMHGPVIGINFRW